MIDNKNMLVGQILYDSMYMNYLIKLTEAESSMVVALEWGGGNGEVDGYKVSILQNE